MELVSVIVPVYNVELYLKKCIDSVLKQSYQKFELLIINDGSTDASASICDGYKEKDSRIKVFHVKNSGLSAARNKGLDEASGKYVFFLDSDDYIKENALECLVNLMKDADADLAVCDWAWADETGIVMNCEIKENSDICIMNAYEFLKSSSIGEGWNNIVAWNKLYKKSIFDNLRFEVGKIHEDVFIFHQICARCNCVATTKEKLYIHIKRQGSITENGLGGKKIDAIEGFLKRLDYAMNIKESEGKEICRNTINMLSYHIFDYVRRNGFDDLELNKLLKKKWSYRIATVILSDRNKNFKERVALSILFCSPRIYGKIWEMK